MHRNLHLGVVGRYYSEVDASCLGVLVLGGLVLWWRWHRPRTGGHGGCSGWTWAPERSLSSQLRHFLDFV
ncbi:PepSY domain-containing protein [Micromonospora sp. WMMD980]|uniref:PepSY domain-containing protein n=1 Tax=Micromonospora sp. WMMD980 TaxID=3016088 RepID=UPI0024178CD6|nr:PepSY domain-containing protein [Micromonospora sp. WMMD980]MDG4803141.1 PepSY domain-containing protein [Micromonospora sp. WMMD980]